VQPACNPRPSGSFLGVPSPVDLRPRPATCEPATTGSSCSVRRRLGRHARPQVCPSRQRSHLTPAFSVAYGSG